MKEYVKHLRSYIGTQPILMCGTSVIIENEQAQVLMLHRTDNDCWCFPGGAVELGETVEAAAKREVLEETGLQVGQLELFGVFSGPELYYQYPNGDEVYNVDIVFCSKANETMGELTINEEGRDIRYFPIHSLPPNISPPVILVVREFVKRLADLTVREG
jgi:8-oxo-dGTP pyrophosphatase MutT (NUDIX family)